jgi:hypothetical protein
MRCIALIGLALFLTGAAKPRPSVAWAVSWSEAVDEAKACNVPIVVHRHGFY